MQTWHKILIFLVMLLILILFLEQGHQCQKKALADHKNGAGTNLLPVLDPVFNMRQICKQCVLLEDHLSMPRMQCRDCIMKHFLYLEGYAEEAITLDKDSKYLHKLKSIPDEIRRMQDRFNADEDYHAIAQDLRKLRKRLIHDCFNMGGALGAQTDGSLPQGAKTCGGGGGAGTCGGGSQGQQVLEGSDECPGPAPIQIAFNTQGFVPVQEWAGKSLQQDQGSMVGVQLPTESPYNYIEKVLPEWVKLL